MGARRPIQGRRNQRLSDDLTERIHTAYYALRRARIHGARRELPRCALSAFAAGSRAIQDGPAASGFAPVPLKGTTSFQDLAKADLSVEMTAALPQAPQGCAFSWDIPFQINRPSL